MTDRPEHHNDGSSGPGPDFTWEAFERANQSAAPREESRFKPCFRHPDASTGITCQRCDRPICGACMTPASVGFLCPECGGTPPRGASGGSGKTGRTRQFRAPSGTGGGPRTQALLDLFRRGTAPWLGAVALLLGLVNVVTGLPAALLGWSGAHIAAGQVWRLVTHGFVPMGVLGALFAAILLIWVGGSTEEQLGTPRFLAVFTLGALGAGMGLSLAHAPIMGFGGTFSAVMGILAALAIGKYRAGMDIRGDLILLGLMVAMNMVLGFSARVWAAHLGAIIIGALAGYIVAYVRSERTQWLLLGAVAVGTVALGYVGLVLL